MPPGRPAPARRWRSVALDIDRFKEVNDKHGHAAGDQVLRVLAGILISGVRGSDLVCRIGGDEFVILLAGAAGDVVVERAERVRAEFAATPIDLGNGNLLRCTLSVGVAVLQGAGEGVESTLRRADAALYEAKCAGDVIASSAQRQALPPADRAGGRPGAKERQRPEHREACPAERQTRASARWRSAGRWLPR